MKSVISTVDPATFAVVRHTDFATWRWVVVVDGQVVKAGAATLPGAARRRARRWLRRATKGKHG